MSQNPGNCVTLSFISGCGDMQLGESADERHGSKGVCNPYHGECITDGGDQLRSVRALFCNRLVKVNRHFIKPESKHEVGSHAYEESKETKPSGRTRDCRLG